MLGLLTMTYCTLLGLLTMTYCTNIWSDLIPGLATREPKPKTQNVPLLPNYGKLRIWPTKVIPNNFNIVVRGICHARELRHSLLQCSRQGILAAPRLGAQGVGTFYHSFIKKFNFWDNLELLKKKFACKFKWLKTAPLKKSLIEHCYL
jgi:hypothetical protein